MFVSKSTGNTPLSHIKVLKSTRIIVSYTLLTGIIIFVILKGDLFQKFSLQLITITAILSFMLMLVNAHALRIICAAYRGVDVLDLRGALFIGALGTLGNSLGGLPIGTAIKFAILRRKTHLEFKQIAAGYTFLSFIMAGTMIACMLITGAMMLLDFYILFLFAMVSVVTLLIVFVLLFYGKRCGFIENLLMPLYRHAYKQLLMIGVLLSFGFLLNYWISGLLLFPFISGTKILFMSSFGLMASILTLSQSIGGIQELSVGFAGLISEMHLIHGIELALSLRIAAIIASLATVLVLFPSQLSLLKSLAVDG